MAFLIIVALIMIICIASSSSKKSQINAVQEVKVKKSVFLEGACRTIEALDILERVSGHLVRFIEPVPMSFGYNFFIECKVFDEDNFLRNHLDSIEKEVSRRSSIKWHAELERKGHPEPLSPEIKSLHELYTIWNKLTDEQIHTLYKAMESFDKNFEEDERIELRGQLPLTAYTTDGYGLNSYLRALGDTIHEKFPNYDIEVGPGGIYFNPGNGSIEYTDV